MTEKIDKKQMKNNIEDNKELQKLNEQFKDFESQVNEMTYDRMKLVPKPETEPQTKLAQSEIDKTQDIYLKPITSIGAKEKFNEKFRPMWEYDKQYVRIIAENNEIKGEHIEMWSKPYPGLPCEFWNVPVNKPIHVPRYLAEQIKRKFYHRLAMQEQVVESHSVGSFYGKIVVDNTIARLDARKAEADKRMIFMGASNF
jgi:hypothetical protein